MKHMSDVIPAKYPYEKPAFEISSLRVLLVFVGFDTSVLSGSLESCHKLMSHVINLD